ncbi:MAG: hypothetical protein M3Y17_04450 [Actinomycetota bacterium]|nr:hypothetical protein [Actinomycetota bacterium]
MSCASSRLCAALDDKGNVLVSANPLGGASTWRTTRLTSSADPLFGVSCPAVSFCVVSGDGAGVAVSNDPTGGAGAWRAFPLRTHHAGAGVGAISCPTAKLCVAENSVELLSSTDPAAGSGAWKDAYIPGELATDGGLETLSCAIAKLCVATDVAGSYLISIDPAAGARSWVTTLGLGFTYDYTLIDSLSCASRSLCVGVDSQGDAYALTDLAAPAVQAAKAHVLKASLGGVAREHPRLAFGVGAGVPPGRAIKTITVGAPRGVAFLRSSMRRGVSVTEGVSVTGHEGRRVGFVLKLRNGRLTITFAHPVSRTQITISGAALRLSRGLAAALTHKRGKKLALVVEVTDAGRVTTTLSLRLKAS